MAELIKGPATRHYLREYLGGEVLARVHISSSILRIFRRFTNQGFGVNFIKILGSSANKLGGVHRGGRRVAYGLRVRYCQCVTSSIGLVLGNHEGPWLHGGVRVEGDAFVEGGRRGGVGSELHFGPLLRADT